MILQQQNINYIIIYIIIPLLFIRNISTKSTQYLQKSNTENMKALAIIIIVIHHFVQRLNNPGLLTPFIGFGYLGVSIFFFLSGYGLIFSYENKNNYLSSFFTKRFSKVCIPFIFVNIIHLIFNITIQNKNYNLIDIIYYMFGIKLLSGELWYILIILLWYALFYFCFKYFSKFPAEKFLYLLALIYFLSCWKFNLTKYWYDTSFIFPLGISFYLRKDKLINIMKKYYLILCTSTFILFGITFVLNHGKTAIQFVIIRALSAIFFTFLVNLFLLKVDMSNNRILTFLGTISFEIYLTHNRFPILQRLSSKNTINTLDIIIYFGIVIIMSIILHKINSFIHLDSPGKA